MNRQKYVRTITRLLLAISIVITLGLGLMTSPPLLPGLETDPIKHAAGLAVVTLLAAIAFPRLSLWLLLIVIAVASLGLEFLQGLPPFQRDPDPSDWMAGMAGAFAALVIVGLGRALWSLIERRSARRPCRRCRLLQ